jgi:hypothetical protein
MSWNAPAEALLWKANSVKGPSSLLYFRLREKPPIRLASNMTNVSLIRGRRQHQSSNGGPVGDRYKYCRREGACHSDGGDYGLDFVRGAAPCGIRAPRGGEAR